MCFLLELTEDQKLISIVVIFAMFLVWIYYQSSEDPYEDFRACSDSADPCCSVCQATYSDSKRTLALSGCVNAGFSAGSKEAGQCADAMFGTSATAKNLRAGKPADVQTACISAFGLKGTYAKLTAPQKINVDNCTTAYNATINSLGLDPKNPNTCTTCRDAAKATSTYGLASCKKRRSDNLADYTSATPSDQTLRDIMSCGCISKPKLDKKTNAIIKSKPGSELYGELYPDINWNDTKICGGTVPVVSAAQAKGLVKAVSGVVSGDKSKLTQCVLSVPGLPENPTDTDRQNYQAAIDKCFS